MRTLKIAALLVVISSSSFAGGGHGHNGTDLNITNNDSESYSKSKSKSKSKSSSKSKSKQSQDASSNVVVNGESHEYPVSPAYAPTVISSGNPYSCLQGISVGTTLTKWAGVIGLNFQDDECNHRMNAKNAEELGLGKDAVFLHHCQIESFRDGQRYSDEPCDLKIKNKCGPLWHRCLFRR